MKINAQKKCSDGNKCSDKNAQFKKNAQMKMFKLLKNAPSEMLRFSFFEEHI